MEGSISVSRLSCVVEVSCRTQTRAFRVCPDWTDSSGPPTPRTTDPGTRPDPIDARPHIPPHPSINATHSDRALTEQGRDEGFTKEGKEPCLLACSLAAARLASEQQQHTLVGRDRTVQRGKGKQGPVMGKAGMENAS